MEAGTPAALCVGLGYVGLAEPGMKPGGYVWVELIETSDEGGVGAAGAHCGEVQDAVIVGVWASSVESVWQPVGTAQFMNDRA